MELRWRRRARDDLLKARRYIAARNPEAAKTMVVVIRTAVRRLGKTPSIGRPGRVDGTRELVVPGTPYIVAYAVIGDTLAVLAVLHSAQEWPENF